MPVTNTKHLIDWLQDAYAMEQTSVDVLEKQAKRLKNYPYLMDKVTLHLAESRVQADRLQACIERLGGNTSALKTGLGRLVGLAGPLAASAAGDEVVKSSLADYAFEHLEVAAYRALVAAAEAAGDEETRRVCAEHLRQEEAMAAWLGEQLPAITKDYLHKESLGLEAKR